MNHTFHTHSTWTLPFANSNLAKHLQTQIWHTIQLRLNFFLNTFIASTTATRFTNYTKYYDI